MPTFSDLKSAIADDIDDTTGEYRTQILRAIQASIRYCERYPFFFNETQAITFETVAGQGAYGADPIGSIVHIERVYLTAPGGEVLDLGPIAIDTLTVLSDQPANLSRPTSWVYFGSELYLWPTPDKVYPVTIQAAPYRLAALVADNDTNAWTTWGYDLVKARAKYILAKDTLKDPNVAAEAMNDFSDQKSALSRETALRIGTGFVIPTQF